MTPRILLLASLLALVPLSSSSPSSAQDAPPEKNLADTVDTANAVDPAAAATRLTAIADAMRAGYGEVFKGVAKDDAGKTVLRFAGGDFLYDDGRQKTYDERLNAPDLEDTFSPLYPLTNPTDKLPENFDPGRFRVEAFFKALYGGSEEEVAKNCVPVNFCGNKVRFNSRCGAAEALAKVGKDLDEAVKAKPALKTYLTNLGGTFQWRFIAGTKQLSNHSFGTAIDLNVDKSAYWRWEKPEKLKTFSRKDWPVEIVEAFERHGFIWGGKWWHFDTMHFEYRPELIHFARAQAGAGKKEQAPEAPLPGKETEKPEGEKKAPPAHEFLEPFKE